MKQENIQLDIPDRQLLSPNAPQSVWTEIGEAQVTHTIFGRAKVRIIRKNDNIRSALWLLLAAALAVAAWQGWVAFQPGEPQQNSDSISPANEKEPGNKPAAQPEIIAPPAARPEVKSEPVIPPQTEVLKQVINQNRALHQPGMQGKVQQPANPVAPHSKPVPVQHKPIAIQPKPVTPQSPALNNNSSLIPGEKPLPAKLAPTPHPAVQPLVTPRPLPAAQSSASSPAAAVTLASPIGKEETPQSPAGDKPLAPAAVPGK